MHCGKIGAFSEIGKGGIYNWTTC